MADILSGFERFVENLMSGDDPDAVVPSLLERLEAMQTALAPFLGLVEEEAKPVFNELNTALTEGRQMLAATGIAPSLEALRAYAARLAEIMARMTKFLPRKGRAKSFGGGVAFALIAVVIILWLAK